MNLRLPLYLSLVTFSMSCTPELLHKRESRSSLNSERAAAEASERYVVVLADSIAEPEVVAEELTLSVGGRALGSYNFALKGFAIEMDSAKEETLRMDERVLYMAKDVPVITASQTLPTGVSRIGTRDNQSVDFENSAEMDLDIAILDTGIDEDHPDLNVYHSKSFVEGEKADDGNGHGTHVAGIVAAKNNDLGVVGVAPGARLWNIKVIANAGQGFLCSVIAGLDYVAEHADKIDVVNMSLNLVGDFAVDDSCGEAFSDPLHRAVCGAVDKGVLIAVSAGNKNKDAETTAPANYPEVLSVSAIIDSDGKAGGLGEVTRYGKDDTLADFSNFGRVVDIAAPGVNIESTWINGETRFLSGTSMAAPHAAAGLGLYTLVFGKPQNKEQVMDALEGLKRLSTSQEDSSGFSGDKDAFPEGLLNIQAINPKPEEKMDSGSGDFGQVGQTPAQK